MVREGEGREEGGVGEAMNDGELRRREVAAAAMDLEGRRRALSIGRDSEETGDLEWDRWI